MSPTAIIPDVTSYVLSINKNLSIHIKPAHNNKIVFCIKDNTTKEYINIPESIYIYNISIQSYLDYIPDTKFYTAPAYESYEIYYKNIPIMNNMESQYTMIEYCDFDCFSKKYSSNIHTFLLKGNVTKDSNIVSVSSCKHLTNGFTVYGEGIPEFATITHVDYKSKTLSLSQPAINTHSFTTLTVV